VRRRKSAPRITIVEPIHDRGGSETEGAIRSGNIVNAQRIFRLHLDPNRYFSFRVCPRYFHSRTPVVDVQEIAFHKFVAAWSCQSGYGQIPNCKILILLNLEATPDSASGFSLLRLDRDFISKVDIGGVVNDPALDLARG
jgi:hypothetical protein